MVLYEDSGNVAWSSGAADNPGSLLILQDDENVVFYKDNRDAV